MTKEALKLALEALEELMAQTESSFFAVKHDHFSLQNARSAIRRGQKALAHKDPPQRTWVGLTDEQVAAIGEEFVVGGWICDFAKAIEAELKEKNDC